MVVKQNPDKRLFSRDTQIDPRDDPEPWLAGGPPHARATVVRVAGLEWPSRVDYPQALWPDGHSTWRTTPRCQHLGLERDTGQAWGSALAQAARASMQLLAMPSRVPRRREASSRPAPMPPPRRVLHYREVPPFISNSACPAKARRRMHRAKPRCPKLPKLLPRLMKHNPKLDPPPSRFCAPHACLSTPAATPVPAAAPAYAEGRDHQMPTSGGPGEPTPPVPGALSAPRAEPRIGEGYPLVPHLLGMMISPLRMLALDSDVCPTPVTRP